MRTLFVAAGGGGDAVGILLARRLLDPDGEGPALISTCAWERLRIDPLPGPRPLSGFTGLGEVGGRMVEVLGSSETVPPGRSMLPRLAAEANARIFLHDFEGGAEGLADLLRSLASALAVDRLVVVDVGGDVVAAGDEPNLLSPLADSLTLAAALVTDIPTTLAVVGPGTDAELTEHEVMQRLQSLGAGVAGSISPKDVQACSKILTWHPTEASALAASAALGERGLVEMRRGGPPTPLTLHGSEIWILQQPRLRAFPLALVLADARSLAHASNLIEQLTVNEIGYESAKAAQLASSSRGHPRSARQVAIEATRNGATHITMRRLLECCGGETIEAVETNTDPEWSAGALVRGVLALKELTNIHI